tara:strand:+ start:2150 stop:2842 length:693 start_codon:yes stop_codon:yes gene_type:complete
MRLLILILVFFTSSLYAHQPKLINYSPSTQNPHKVEFPEISKAYYGKLTGEPHYYQIQSDEEFLFYSGILSPKVNDNYKWLSIDVLDENNNIVYQANGSNFNWEPWYEPYARDWYWKGPEIGANVNLDTGFKRSFLMDAGTYLIKVYNNDNEGHYSLAIGEAEFFGSNLWEQILTWTPILFYIGPYMDIFHWNKFDVRAYIPHIALLVLCFIIHFIIRKIFFNRRKNFAK